MLTGSALRFDIWKKEDDHYNWDKYIEYFQREPAFGKEKSEKLIEIYQFLREELGNSYLKNSNSDGNNLVNYWLWSRGGNYSEILWFYNGLKHFKTIPDSNYEKLIKHLRSDNKCNEEGIPFLIAADSLRKAGFNVEFEPKVDFIKKPDLKIVDPTTNEVIFGDVSQLYDSDAKENSSNTYFALIQCFHRETPFVQFAGKIHDAATKEDIVALRKYISELKHKANNELSFEISDEKYTKGIITFAVAHDCKLSELEAWEKTRKFDGLNNLRSQPLELNYTNRLISKIQDKSKQLSYSNTPGVMYIPVPSLFLLFGLLEPMETVEKIKDCLKRFPHIIGVCIYSHIGNEGEEFKELVDMNLFERKIIHNYIQQDVWFIANNEFDHKNGIEFKTLMKIYKSFELVFQ